MPRQWKVIETVREKFTCRDCEKISQAPAPFDVIPRGWAGPSLLAMLLYEKFGQHQPLNRQTERYALEGVPISLSTAADSVGACCTVLEPPSRLLEGTHPTSAVLSYGYFAKRVTLSLALRSSGDAGRGLGRVGAAAALVEG